MPVELRVRKRKRARLACNPCRARKAGCDGRRPACSLCTTRGIQAECFYPDSVRNPQSQLEGHVGLVAQPVNSPGASESSAAALVDVLPVPSAEQDENVGPDPGQFSNNAEATYGLSSNATFLKEISGLVEAQGKLPHNPDEGGVPTLLGYPDSRPSSPGVHLRPMKLPERRLVQEFTHNYWVFVHPVFPILHKPSFTTRATSLLFSAASTSVYDPIFQATLSIMLAMGSQRTERLPIAQRESLADELYKQSCRLVSVDFLDESSVRVVQLLLLRGIYLHYSTHADRCWNTIGLALRVAQGLGLGYEDLDLGATNQLTREMRRRVWHNAVTLDRLTATTFGRPVLLQHQGSTPRPSIIDDEHLLEVGNGLQPKAHPSRLAFFVHSIEVMDILNDILARFYTKSMHVEDLRGHDGQDWLQDILRLDMRLGSFDRSLPDYLRVDFSAASLDPELGNCLKMQARILKTRILWIRLLLLRPALLADVRDYSTHRQHATQVGSSSVGAPCLGDSLRLSIHKLCLETAEELLQEMHEQLGDSRQNSVWHVLLFTFAAASTFVASTLCIDLDLDLEQDRAKLSWERSLRIFEYHEPQVPSIRKGSAALQTLCSFANRMRRQRIEGETAPDADGTMDDFPEIDACSSEMIPGLDEFLSFDMLNENWFQTFGLDSNGGLW